MLTKYFLGRAVRIDYLCVIYIYTNAKPEYIYNNQTIDKQNRLCDPRNIGEKNAIPVCTKNTVLSQQVETCKSNRVIKL